MNNKDIAELVNLLKLASEKLEIYRKEHSGVYTGGVEYQHLQDMIKKAIEKHK